VTFLFVLEIYDLNILLNEVIFTYSFPTDYS
jgi:hypothetical protein